MGGLAPVHHKQLEKFVCEAGCTFQRQKGSHRAYWREGLQQPIIIPRYKNIPVFIIRNILRQLGISVEDYLRIMGHL